MRQAPNFATRFRYLPLLLIAALLLGATAAGAAQQTGAAGATAQDGSAADTHYGWFGLLDHRSKYGQFWFPEPFRMDETDVDNEIRFDWLHQEGKGKVSNEMTAEIEKSFGVTTFELEIPYERESERVIDPVAGASHEHARGTGNVELSVRRPIYQFVSRDGFFDNTVGVGFELGIPTDSDISDDTEIVGKMFDSMRLGQHFSLQALGGYSVLIGPGEEGGHQTFEYGLVAGYNVTREQLAIPHVEQIIPIFELTGETGLNRGEAGNNNLSGTIGVRANLDAIGPLQPRLGVGYVFPIDNRARDEFKWGLITSLVFEY